MKTPIALVLALLAAPLAASLASAATDSDATPPGPSAPRKLELPRIEKSRLGNGLTLEIVEDHRLPLVTIRLGLPAGSAADAAGEEGTAEAAAASLEDG